MVVNLKQFSLSILLTFSLFSFSLSNPHNSDFTTLLAFKLSSDTSNSLASWSYSSSEPCSWLGVTCDSSMHRVTKLVLNHLNLTGSIQALTRLTELRQLSLHHNQLSSAPNFTSWPNLKHLYLGHNRFTGLFPSGISHLRRIRRLDISYNRFSGEIPMSELTHLPRLLTLRLEFNSFTGPLNLDESPSILMSDFNVSGNNLTGKIPNFLSKFPATSFSRNNNLCGNPLPSNCSNPTSGSKPMAGGGSEQIRGSGERKKNLSDRAVLTIISIDVAAVVATLLIVAYCCYMRRYRYRETKGEVGRFNCNDKGNYIYGVQRENEEMVCFEGCKGFTKVDDLLKASAEMLGKGSVGTTYKVVMEDGDRVLAVKRVRERRKKKEIDGVLREIGGLRHPNILSLRAYHSSKDELLLVYDFLPNGSLHSLLHGNRGPGRTPLDWTTRVKFAAGSAQGLAFLHSYNKSKLFHGHLTTSNIIIDHLGNACISDIGLHQLLPMPPSSNNAYKAPEQMLNTNSNNNHQSKFLQKCDVYSFGVVLLEILTGKMATSEGEASLAKWVQRVVREEWTWEILDFELMRYKEMEEEMVALLRVALLCLASASRDRPKMSIVHKMIEDIREKGTREGRTQSPLNATSCDSSSSDLSESTPNFTSN